MEFLMLFLNGSNSMCLDWQQLPVPHLIDLVGIIEPAIILWKNAFVQRWVFSDQKILIISDWFEGNLPIAWRNPSIHSFEQVQQLLIKHCSMVAPFMNTSHSCMSELADPQITYGARSACQKSWPRIKPIFDGFTSRYCNLTTLQPKPHVVEHMRMIFPDMFNIMGCFVTDGRLDFLGMEDDQFWQTEFGSVLMRAFFSCSLDRFFNDMAVHLQRLFLNTPLGVVDSRDLVDFISRMSRTTSGPLRCTAKIMYPYCAAKGVDLNSFFKGFFQHMDMASGGIINIPDGRLDFSIAKNYGSKNRTTVQIFGDPHIRSLFSDRIMTCSELRVFEIYSTGDHVMSDAPVTLIMNEFYHVSALLSKFHMDAQGTYLSYVEVKFLSEGVDPMTMAQPTICYNTNNTMTTPVFIMKWPGGNITTLTRSEMKYSTGKMIHIQRNRSRTIIKDDESGTVIVISNPYGEVLNVQVRGAMDLFDVSNGLLIHGCFDEEDRDAVIEKVIVSRKKRQVDYSSNETCSDVPLDMYDTCIYDLIQGAPIDQVADSFVELNETSEIIEEPDELLRDTAIVETVDNATVATTLEPEVITYPSTSEYPVWQSLTMPASSQRIANRVNELKNRLMSDVSCYNSPVQIMLGVCVDWL